MLALTLNKNSELKITNKRLNKLNPNKYRIKILYSGVCSSDFPRAFRNGSYNYPLIMGHELSGYIIEKGSKTKKYNLNDAVAIYPLIPKCKDCSQCKNGNFNLCINYSYYGSRQNGGFAEYLDVNEWNIYKLNNKIDLKLASLIEPTAVAFNTFKKMKLKSKNNEILIIGCGFLGQILTIILYQNDFKNITCIDRNKFKLDYLKKFAKKRFLGNLNLLKNKNFDCIVDFVGSSESFKFSLKNLNPQGNYVLTANIYDNLLLEKEIINLIARKEIKIFGVWNSNHKGKQSNWNLAEKFLIKNKINIFKIITHKIKLIDSVNFFSFLKNYKSNKKNKEKFLKALIEN